MSKEKKGPEFSAFILGGPGSGKTMIAMFMVAKRLPGAVVVYTKHKKEWKSTACFATSDLLTFKRRIEQQKDQAAAHLTVVIDERYDKTDEAFDDLLVTAHTHKMSVIVVSKTLQEIASAYRDLFDQTVVCHGMSVEDLHNIHKQYAQQCCSFQSFFSFAGRVSPDPLWLDNKNERTVYHWKGPSAEVKQSITNRMFSLECSVFAGLEEKHDEKAKSGATKCVVCTENRSIVAFSPCGHVPVCVACAKQLKRAQCPLCRCACTSALLLRGI